MDGNCLEGYDKNDSEVQCEVHQKKSIVINELMSATGGETRTGATRQVYATPGTLKIALDIESKAHEP